MNQETLERLAITRDIAARRLQLEILVLEAKAYDQQNTSSKTPPSDTRT